MIDINKTVDEMWSTVTISKNETHDKFINYLFECDISVIVENFPKILQLSKSNSVIVEKMTTVICSKFPDRTAEIKSLVETMEHVELSNESDLVDNPLRKEIDSSVDVLSSIASVNVNEAYVKSTEYLLGLSSEESLVTESVSMEHIGTMSPDVFDDVNEDIHTLHKSLYSSFQKKFIEFSSKDSKNIKKDIELLNELYELSDTIEYVSEASSVARGARRVARKGETASRKAVHKLRKAGHETKRVKVIAKKIPGNFDNLINSTFGAIQRMDHAERRKRILEGGFRFKIYKIIRNGIVIGAAWAVTPALAAIAIIVHVAKDKTLDFRARNELIKELEAELNITKEKIRDADQKGDTRKKYQLMRIENRLERDLERIKFKLGGNRAPHSQGVN